MSQTSYFAKSSTYNFLSNLVIVLTAFAYTYLAANILGPEVYGVIIYLLAFMGALPNIFGFETISDIITVYTAKWKSKKLLFSLLYPVFSFLGLIALIIFYYPNLILSFIEKGTIPLIQLTAIFIFLSPISVFFNSLFMGFKKFGKILYFTIIEKVSDLVFLFIFLVILKQGMYSLIYAKIISIILLSIAYMYFLPKLKFEKKKIDKKELGSFASTSFLANLARGWALQIEILLTGALLGGVFLGIFLLLKKIAIYLYEYPQMAISNVLLPFLSEKTNEKNSLVSYTSLVLKFQILLNILISIGFILIIPFLITLFFPAYIYGIQIIPLLVIGLIFNFISPLIRLLKSINKNLYIAIGHGIFGLSFLLLAYWLIPKYSIFGAAIAYSFSRLISTGFLYLAIRHLGYPISFIPTIKDLKFFWNQTFIFLKSFLDKKSV